MEQKEPYLFTLDECELASAEDRRVLVCQSVCHRLRVRFDQSAIAHTLPSQNVLKGVEVPLIEIVPDIAMAQYKKIAFSQIEMGAMIGQGTFTHPFIFWRPVADVRSLGAYADVYKATYEGKTVAVKKLNNSKGFKEFRAEVKFMSVVDHPNIVTLKGICLNPPCIITEFMDLGTLTCPCLVKMESSCVLGCL